MGDQAYAKRRSGARGVDNGRAAVAAAQATAFDAILMDVQMPVLSGLDATAAIRARERLRLEADPARRDTERAPRGRRETRLALR
jgi:CheY-like chemotaxis protein